MAAWVDFFRASIAGVSVIAGTPHYAFLEQARDASGGLTPAVPPRGNASVYNAQELNGRADVPVGEIVWMRQYPGGAGLLFEFIYDGLVGGGTVSGPVTFSNSTATFGPNETVQFSGPGDVVNYGTPASGTNLAAPAVNVYQPLTTVLYGSATQTVQVSTGGGSPTLVTLYAVTPDAGGTTATVGWPGTPVSITDNTTVTLTAGKILTWAGGAGSSWVSTIPTVDLTGVTTLSLPASVTVGGSPIPALASGSGLSDVLTGSPARWYAAGLRGGYSPASSPLTSGTLYAMPLRGYGGRTIDKIKLSVSTAAGAAKHARMGIYATTSAGTPYPAALIADGGAFLIDSTGDKVTTLGSAVVLSTQTVWLVVLCEDNVTIKGMSAGGLDCELGLQDDWTTLSGSNPGGVGWGAVQAYGALPGTFPSSAGSATLLDGTAVPLLGAHFSA